MRSNYEKKFPNGNQKERKKKIISKASENQADWAYN
jgi:hypothetical protein